MLRNFCLTQKLKFFMRSANASRCTIFSKSNGPQINVRYSAHHLYAFRVPLACLALARLCSTLFLAAVLIDTRGFLHRMNYMTYGTDISL